ncbi:OST-HTH/LOTUS domain-containing protein [Marinobacter pelagius]|uniref:OST-HTH/LOTUS domain-containing protein n=1 Tax=Marinobacter sp. C7 TaxID=2951363 RepID=UPI001EF13BB9|nr:OST-HTH/LOTUS domain-containing protein [Marinobacter sp. C7]MCG7199639.1 OST-HTH/LOTUS domain-containing protein [Marinobacter sp. C7]
MTNDFVGESLENIRAEIERGVGQCILQLQQYELGLKRFLSKTVLRGNAKTLKSYHEIRKADLANKTLGQLIGQITGQYLLPSSSEEGFPDTPVDPEENSDLAELQFRFTMPLSQENHDALRAELSEIVSIRNELVHHFLERFDLQDTGSCKDALNHLTSIKETVSHHFEKLQEWDSARNAAVQHALEFFDSVDLESLLNYGFCPGHPIVWGNTTAVQLLKSAEAQLQSAGWTDLRMALRLIKQQRPDLGPKIYQCNSWRHLLHASGLFELKKVKQQDQSTSTLFRSR